LKLFIFKQFKPQRNTVCQLVFCTQRHCTD